MRLNKSSCFVICLALSLLLSAAMAYAQRPERPRPRPSDRGEGPRTPIERLIPVPQEGQVRLNIWPNKACGSTYYIGEHIDISFTVDQDSYVTIYDIDVTGNVTILFPNAYYKDNLARAGRVYTIPNKFMSYTLVVEGPSGLELLEGIASTDGYYHWFFDGTSLPPIWSNQWGDPSTWGGKYVREPIEGPDGEPPGVTQRFEKRLQFQGQRDPNQIANYIRDQIRDQARVKVQPGYSWGRASCAFYVIHYLGYTEYDPGLEQPYPPGSSYPPQPYPPQPYPPGSSYPPQPYPYPASYGLLIVNSFPQGAQVSLDGRYYGITPLTLYQVGVGLHRLRVEKAGYTVYEQTVQIKSGAPTQIDAYLQLFSPSSEVPRR